jgi:Bacteriocin-protection, YdeI or OmpD-Associated
MPTIPSTAAAMSRGSTPRHRILQRPDGGQPPGAQPVEVHEQIRHEVATAQMQQRVAGLVASASTPRVESATAIGMAISSCSDANRRYRCLVSSQRVPGGVVHKLPADLREALVANTTALGAWKDITPLARNEFICWVEEAKQDKTRERRIRRTQEELEDGQRRPCCWAGCKHRDRTGS